MTRKVTMNAENVLESAEHLLFVLEVAGFRSHSMFVDNAMDGLSRQIAISREPFKIDMGLPIPFPETE